MKLKKPEREADYKRKNWLFWFEEMIKGQTHDEDCYNIKIEDNKMWWTYDNEPYSPYGENYQHELMLGYKKWLIKKELKNKLKES